MERYCTFIGMISQNKGQELHLFAGFRQKTSLVTNFVEQMNDYLATKKYLAFTWHYQER